MPDQTTRTRRIVQISTCGVTNHASTQCDSFVYALCDDGSVWMTDEASHKWTCFPPIPQGETDA